MAYDSSPSSGSWFQGLVFVVLVAALMWLAARSSAPERPLMPGAKTLAVPTVVAPELAPAINAEPAPAAPLVPAAGGGDSWQ